MKGTEEPQFNRPLRDDVLTLRFTSGMNTSRVEGTDLSRFIGPWCK
jgi:hypothetical protein